MHYEVETILGISISQGMTEDSQSWAWTKNGEFLVKSTYGVALKVLEETKKIRDGGDCLDSAKMKKMFKVIWSLNCPSKIKHFMWRSCKNILPTNHCLRNRKIVMEEDCVLVGKGRHQTIFYRGVELQQRFAKSLVSICPIAYRLKESLLTWCGILWIRQMILTENSLQPLLGVCGRTEMLLNTKARASKRRVLRWKQAGM